MASRSPAPLRVFLPTCACTLQPLETPSHLLLPWEPVASPFLSAPRRPLLAGSSESPPSLLGPFASLSPWRTLVVHFLLFVSRAVLLFPGGLRSVPSFFIFFGIV